MCTERLSVACKVTRVDERGGSEELDPLVVEVLVVTDVGTDATVRIWDPATGAAQRTLEEHAEWVNGRVNAVCAVRSDGHELLASGGTDGTVQIWDPATGALKRTLQGHTGWVNGACPIHVKGREVLASAGDDDTVRIWDPATGAQRLILKAPTGLHQRAPRE